MNFSAQRHEFERNSHISLTNFAVGFAENRGNFKFIIDVNNGLLSLVGTKICKGAGTILPDLYVFFYG